MNVSSVTAGCSPMKPAFGQEQNPQKHQKVQAINIDKAVDVINDIDFKNIDERSARNIARLADAINETEENAKYTKPLKQFFTTASLALLGGISAKVSAGKVLQLVEKNIPIMDWMSKEITRYGQKFVSGIKVSNERNFKGFVSRLADDSITWVKNFSKKGLKQTQIDDFVEKNIRNVDDAAEAAFLKDAAVTQNGIKKTIQNGVGLTAGTGVITQTTKDKNEDGIPDMYQGKKTQEDILKEKLVDVALDSLIA